VGASDDRRDRPQGQAPTLDACRIRLGPELYHERGPRRKRGFEAAGRLECGRRLLHAAWGTPNGGSPSVRKALIAITSVVLVVFYGQTRICFAMCRDGLLPEGLATVNARYGTPVRLTVGLGALIAVLAALVPLSKIVELVNIGTLFAFVLVNIGVIILRRTRPDMPRPYRVPLSPWFPLLGVAFAVYLMKDLPLATWIRFVLWLAVGILIYALYGYRNSRLRRAHGEYGILPAERADILHRHDSHD
jgi:C-terminus of AA_permease